MPHPSATFLGNSILPAQSWRLIRIITLALGSLCAGQLLAAQIDISGPAGSGRFGESVTVLPNGNFVVCDPRFDLPGPIVDVGAVYLFDPGGALISTLTGSTAGDQVGSRSIVVLANGNFVLISNWWDRGPTVGAGAATFVNGSTGLDGIVSEANSLVGTASGDFSDAGIARLSNGNYVVVTPYWDDGTIINTGAVTWASGSLGASGTISIDRSVIGSSAEDRVGTYTTRLTNGNYVVSSPWWDNAGLVDAGAATWLDGTQASTGRVSAANSLVGGSASDRVGMHSVTPMINGNYVVNSRLWSNGMWPPLGAVTWGDGTVGVRGVLSGSNSLVGTTPGDEVGSAYVWALSNGNYVVASPRWSNSTATWAGAATWGDGSIGVTGPVSTLNSLVGTQASDAVGAGVLALPNGNYVVANSGWKTSSGVRVGAATWRDGTTASPTEVSPANSLIGVNEGDNVGLSAVALANSNYLVHSPDFKVGGAERAGAVTWGNGATGIVGVVSLENSLLGSSAGETIGAGGQHPIFTLANGNYLVSSINWGFPKVGALTWGNGSVGTTGYVSSLNSFIGIQNNAIDFPKFASQSDGSYVVGLRGWSPAIGVQTWTGAIVRNDGISPLIGSIGNLSASNALVGSWANSGVGESTITAYPNGNYVTSTSNWQAVPGTYVGAVTVIFGDGSTIGTISAGNSVIGQVGVVPGSSNSMVHSYDATRSQLVVGQRAANVVSIFRPGHVTTTAISTVVPAIPLAEAPVAVNVTLESSSVPTVGTMRVYASSGEDCLDATPTAASTTTAAFSCALVFSSPGVRTLRAEFFGTRTHGYSISPAIGVSVGASVLFADGFESP